MIDMTEQAELATRPSRHLRSVHKVYALRLTLTVALIVLWQVSARHFGPDLLSEPWPVLMRLVSLVTSGELFTLTAVTLLEAAGGMAIGGSLGVLLPFLINFSPRAAAMVEPFIRGAVGVPKLALSPLLILWFGIGLQSKIVLVALMVFFMTYVATAAGIRSVPKNLLATARIFGAGPWRLARDIKWNATQPFIWAAMKAALPWSIGAALVGEFIAAESGLGYYIHHAHNNADMVGAYAGVVAVTVLVIMVDLVMVYLRSRALAWRPADSRTELH